MYILLFNTCVKSHTKAACIAKILTKVTVGELVGYFLCSPGMVVVSVLTSRSRDVPMSRLGLVSRRLGLVSVSGGRRLGLGHLRLVPKTNFRPNCAGHSTQCERALDVVNLCCSYYYSSY